MLWVSSKDQNKAHTLTSSLPSSGDINVDCVEVMMVNEMSESYADTLRLTNVSSSLVLMQQQPHVLHISIQQRGKSIL